MPGYKPEFGHFVLHYTLHTSLLSTYKIIRTVDIMMSYNASECIKGYI